MNDLISRQAASRMRCGGFRAVSGCRRKRMREYLKKIGTNRRSDYVLATVEVKGERMTVTNCTQDGAWDWNMKYAFPDYKVVTWMLPGYEITGVYKQTPEWAWR